MQLQEVNNSPYAWGIALLILNVGSRYIMEDIGKFHQKILTNDLVKKFILFCLFFVATRDIVVSLILTLVFSIIVYGFFHENSKFTLVPDEDKINKRIEHYFDRISSLKK